MSSPGFKRGSLRAGGRATVSAVMHSVHECSLRVARVGNRGDSSAATRHAVLAAAALLIGATAPFVAAPVSVLGASMPGPNVPGESVPDIAIGSRVVVRLESSPELTPAGIETAVSSVEGLDAGSVVGSSDTGEYAVVEVAPDADPADVAEALGEVPGIDWARPDEFVTTDATVPNDPSYGSLWGMANINAPAAWDRSTGNPSVVVAVLDTGINFNHPDLAANIWTNPGEVPGNGLDDDGNGYVDDVSGWDFHDNDNIPQDGHGHGTHVSGTIGAVGNNGIGVVGVNWNVKIVPLKVLGDSGWGYWSSVAEAIEYATAMGFTVSNNSYGSTYPDPWVLDAITAAQAAGHTFVAAAGNNGGDSDLSPFYPAAFPMESIVSVAAIDSADNKASFSNYGDTTVDLGAPGVNILSTYFDGYVAWSGTSMASPHVAGAAAMLRGRNPDWTAAQIKSRLLSSSRAIASLAGRVVSGGTLDLAAAVQPTVACTVNGGPGDDVLVGTAGDDIICAGAGNDTINGFDGDDKIVPGPGNDTIDGGSGTNTIGFDDAQGPITVDLVAGTATGDGTDTFSSITNVDGSSFDDVIHGSDESNRIRGFRGNDTILARDGNDVISADLGADIVYAGGGNDVVGGGLGNDLLFGEAGNDTINGLDGDDLLNGGEGDDAFNGGIGIDTVDFAAVTTPMQVDLAGGAATGQGSDSLAAVEHVISGSGNDALLGDGGPNRLEGRGGSDQIDGRDGDDVILGGAGNDVLNGGSGVDEVSFEFATTPIVASLTSSSAIGEGSDALIAFENLTGGVLDDTLTGSGAANRMRGLGGDDTIDAGAGDDVVLGGAGDDELNGGPGIDTWSHEGAGADLQIVADLSTNSSTGEGSDSGIGFENLNGSGGDDILIGNDLANEIRAFRGDDFIDGRGGDDTWLQGDVGDDVVLGGTGNDVLRGGTGADILSGMAGNDSLNGFTNDPNDLAREDDLCVQGTGTGTPVNCERTVMPITPSAVSFIEPLTGQAVANFVMSIPAPTDAAVKFTAKTTNGTALSGSDYVALAAKVFTIPAGATSVQVPVTVKGDALDEPDETFNLVLSNPVGATLSKTTAVATIVDTDDPPGFSVADATVVEGNGTKTVLAVVTLPAALKTSASVKLATTPTGTATSGVDYSAKAPTTVTFPAGSVRKTVAITIKGDTVIEPNETFGLALSSPIGAPIIDGTGVVTIVDDDTTPVLSVQPVATIEGNSGTRLATFTLRLDRPSGKTVSVKYQTANGTATAGTDYTAKALTTVSFTPGQTTKTVTVTIRGDLVKEPNETYTLQFSAPLNVTLATTQVTGSITNDD